MSKAKLEVRLPVLPAAEFFAEAKHSIMSDDGTALLSYDTGTCSGFIYYITDKAWSIMSPVDFHTWALLVRAAGFTVSDCEDARRWFRACCPHPSGANVLDFPGRTSH